MECDLKFPPEIIERTRNIPLCPYQMEANPHLFHDYMNFNKQQTLKKHIN